MDDVTGSRRSASSWIDDADCVLRHGFHARKLRIEYPGAIDSSLNRDDRREHVFHDDLDPNRFARGC